MIPSLWAGLHGWLLPGLPFLPGAPWPWDIMWSDISWVFVWLDGHLDTVTSYIHLGICQFQWIYQGILSSSHQWIWCTWALVFLLQVILPLLLSEWVLCLPSFCWVEWSWQHSSLGPQVTSHMLGDPRELDQVCLQCTSMSGSCVVGLQGCLTCCKGLAWFKQGPGQWTGHLGRFVSDAVVGTDRGVVCYLHIWCQSWQGLRQCLYCWHLQAVLWPCTLHCTTGNSCCWWSSPLGAHLLLFCSPLQQWTGLCVGVFSLFWLWQLVLLSPFHDSWTGVDDGTLVD